MSQTERLMAIIDKLSKRNGNLTTEWITSNFEISPRQARRDIEYIRDRLVYDYLGSSVDLVFDRSSGCYKLTGSNEELESLFARSVISSAVAASANDPLMELFGGEDKTLSRKKRVRFLSQAAELPDYTTFSLLMNAIEDKKRVRIWYRTLEKVDSERTVEPLELINYSAIWYLRAFDLSKGELRTFSLSRIRKSEVLDERIAFSSYDLLDEQDQSGYGIFMGNAVEEYTIHFYDMVALIVSNQIWHKAQKGRWIDKRTYELTLPASNATELVAKVLSYGSDAKPITPESFVSRYNNEIDKLIDRRQSCL